MADLLGVGWAFPVGVDARGRIALARHNAISTRRSASSSITPKGQRVMRPEFGSNLHDLIFAPNNATTAGLAAYYVEEALGMWEPRITVLEVDAHPDEADPGRLLIEILYEIKATYDRRTLVFPFYRIPEEAPPSVEG